MPVPACCSSFGRARFWALVTAIMLGYTRTGTSVARMLQGSTLALALRFGGPYRVMHDMRQQL